MTLHKLAIAALMVAFALPASAWGQREQDTLRGLIIGGAVMHHMDQHQPYRPYVDNPPLRQRAPRVVYQPAPIYYPSSACQQVPVIDQYGRLYQYRIVCN